MTSTEPHPLLPALEKLMGELKEDGYKDKNISLVYGFLRHYPHKATYAYCIGEIIRQKTWIFSFGQRTNMKPFVVVRDGPNSVDVSVVDEKTGYEVRRSLEQYAAGEKPRPIKLDNDVVTNPHNYRNIDFSHLLS